MSFGTRLMEARKRKGLTQEGLGKGLATGGEDASKSVVYGWEKDQHFPRVDQLVLICEKLGCSSDYLLFGTVAEGTLPAEISDLAHATAQLPDRQRDWVVMTLREAVKLAKETVAPVTRDREDAVTHSGSTKRRAA